jgi:hypothetical protein
MKTKNLKFCCDFLMQHFWQTKLISMDISSRSVFANEFKENSLNAVEKNIIKFCPWCGYEFPKNLEKEWKNILKNELKLTEKQIEDKQYPSEFNTDEWWIKRNI